MRLILATLFNVVTSPSILEFLIPLELSNSMIQLSNLSLFPSSYHFLTFNVASLFIVFGAYCLSTFVRMYSTQELGFFVLFMATSHFELCLPVLHSKC